MTPLPWSPSSLDKFTTCPKQFHETVVLKKFKQAKTPEIIWGEKVHKDFELRQKENRPLPKELQVHEEYMRKLEEGPAIFYTEQKIALNTKLEPCNGFAVDVWFRGVVDFFKEDGTRAKLIDYKTGKPHTKFRQLDIYAWYIFLTHKTITNIDAAYYWTKYQQETTKKYYRVELPQIWNSLKPEIVAYRNAFKTETWQPKPSGLCNGWCPVTNCEFWRPKR